MRILMIGGGVFLGPAFVDSALRRGHAITVFNRGRSRHDWPPGVDALMGDRRTDLTVLQGRGFDAVVDSCGYVPADVRASAAALADCGRYCFVSSISAYASLAEAPVREDATLAASDDIADDDRDPARYGAQKAACERALEAAFGSRSLIVRPGLIVGPGDRTGRFSYWPWRALAGGSMLVPDVPAGEPIQVVDVRDLADLMVRLLEDEAGGAFNVTGPSPGPALDWPRLIDACLAAASRRGAPPARVVRVAEDFLLAEGVAPWSELPVWVPSGNPAERAFARIDCSRAIAAGLATRPLDETIDAVLDEADGVVDGDPRRKGKLTREREAGLVACWLAHPPGSPGTLPA